LFIDQDIDYLNRQRPSMFHSLTSIPLLSLRSGLAAIATIGFLSGFALFVTGWVVAVRLGESDACWWLTSLMRQKDAQISDMEKLALDLHLFVYLLLVIFSAVGYVGL
jgi:hypothetical protein